MPTSTNTQYPTALDDLPEVGVSAKENDPGLEHDVVHDRVNGAINAIQALLGTDDGAIEGSVLARLLGVEAGRTPQYDGLALSNLTAALAVTNPAGVWVAPCDCTLQEVFIALGVAQSTSGAVTIDAKRAGASIFSVLPSIDANETSSLSGGVGVLSTTAIAKGDVLVFSIVTAGTGAKGLQARIRFKPT